MIPLSHIQTPLSHLHNIRELLIRRPERLSAAQLPALRRLLRDDYSSNGRANCTWSTPHLVRRSDEHPRRAARTRRAPKKHATFGDGRPFRGACRPRRSRKGEKSTTLGFRFFGALTRQSYAGGMPGVGPRLGGASRIDPPETVPVNLPTQNE